MKTRAEGRENGGGIRPPFAEQLARCRGAYELLERGRSRWLARIVASEHEGRETLERLYRAGVEPREVLSLLFQARFTIGTQRRLSPTGARRAALGLRALRTVLEAVEQTPPCKVTFKAEVGDDTAGAITWSLAQYVTEWVPKYLEACADGTVKASLIVTHRQADRGLRRCAQQLVALMQKRTGQPRYEDVGALLHAAFPKHFHRGTEDGDDHADAARDLLRRARGTRQ